ncbi:MAG: hypothetical protein J6T47_08765, partial [Lachnospiraceae bacterium]|nr:hypothetical protein [Lachnospiraceae bacterium]
CVVTDRNGKTYNSASATLAMAPTITTQPAGKIVPVGGTAEFTVAAKGAGTLSYQWQAYNPSTQKWVNSVAACAKTATYTITAQAVHQGFKFRCVVSDAFGNKTTTNAANLVVRPGLTAQPNNATVKVGETAKFTIGAKGVGKLSYQWQVWDAATQTWKNSASASAKTATFSFAAQKGHNGKQFRCIVTDGNGQKTESKEATMYLKPAITTQPKNTTVTAGTKAIFTVVANGKANLSYQWQSRKNSSSEWVNSGQEGAKTATLKVTTNAGLTGWQFRCIVTDGNGQKSESKEAILTVK